MATLRAYSTIVQAQQAVSFLLRRGVPAVRISDSLSILNNNRWRHFVVVDEADMERAESLVAQLEKASKFSGADWEAQAVPDISVLSPERAPACPHCGQILPLGEPECSCPGCAAVVDVVALLIARHGPEVLAECYPVVVDVEGDMTESTVVCPDCRYSLTGLATHGVCPECGLVYDKYELLQRRAGL